VINSKVVEVRCDLLVCGGVVFTFGAELGKRGLGGGLLTG
jgi:hypothetical protein